MPRIFHAPGVYREEIDLSEILVPAGVSNGGIVVRAPKGPVNRPVLITNDKDYVDTFGQPYFQTGTSGIFESPLDKEGVPEYGYGAYAALNFLKESQVLYVVRGVTDNKDKYSYATVKANLSANTNNGVSAIATIGAANNGISAVATTIPDKTNLIQNLDSWAYSNLTDNLLVASIYPGDDGNNYAITVEPLSNSADWRYSYDNYTSADVSVTSAYPIASKVFKINVYDKGSKNWTDYMSLSGDVAAQRLRIAPVESFYGSLTPVQDSNKSQLFIEDVVNGSSKYIYIKVRNGAAWQNVPVASYNVLPVKVDSTGIQYVDYTRLITLGGGVSYQDTGFNSTNGWALFQNRETANVGILIAPTWNVVVKQYVASIAATRQDCIAVVQAGDPSLTAVNDFSDPSNDSREQYGYLNPSYVAIYCGWSKDYDQYNDRFVYLPNALYAAMLYARTDNVANPWDAPAGLNRATLQVFDQRRTWLFPDEIGALYDKNINCVRFIPGTGFVMWGQKTAQLKKSALDRVNVRRNLLFIENNCESNLVQFCFENNDIRTRSRIFSLLDPFLSRVKSGGGLYDYKIVVDESNNTAEVIDANQMNVDIYVQPVKTAEFINLRTIVTRTGISFEEVRVS